MTTHFMEIFEVQPLRAYLLAALASVYILSSIGRVRRKTQRDTVLWDVALSLISFVGASIVLCTNNIFAMVLGFDLFLIPLLFLASFWPALQERFEAFVKTSSMHFLFTTFSLFGAIFLYLSSGSFDYQLIFDFAGKNWEHPWVGIGAFFLLMGFLGKFAAVPCHSWLPDQIEAADTAIAGQLWSAVLLVGGFVIISILGYSIQTLRDIWVAPLYFVSCLSMLVGAVFAGVQSSLKRVLAYTGIFWVGMICGTFAALASLHPQSAASSSVFSLISVAFMMYFLFELLSSIEPEGISNLQTRDLTGLFWQKPKVAAVFTIFVFSLVGLPPTIGFWSRLLAVRSVIQAELYGVLSAMILSFLLLLLVYLRIIGRVFSKSTETPKLQLGRGLTLTNPLSYLIVFAALCVVVFGAFGPQFLLDFSQRVSSYIVKF